MPLAYVELVIAKTAHLLELNLILSQMIELQRAVRR